MKFDFFFPPPPGSFVNSSWKACQSPSVCVGSNYSINIPMPLHSPTGVELCCVVPYHPGTFPEYLCKFRMPQVLCLVHSLYTKVIQGIAYVDFVSRNSKLSVLGLMFSKFPCQKAQHKHTVVTWFSPSSASNQVKPSPALRKQVRGSLVMPSVGPVRSTSPSPLGKLLALFRL